MPVVVDRLRRWTYRRRAAYLLECPLPAAASGAGPGRLPPTYSFCLLGLRHAAACAALTGVPPEEFQRRMAAGDECFAILCRDRPVHVAWVHRGPFYVRGLDLDVAAPDADYYVYGVATHPGHRGKGLYSRAMQELLCLLARRGAARIRQVVERHNAVPLKTLPKLGYEIAGDVVSTSVLGLTRTVCRNGRSRRVTYHRAGTQPEGVYWI